MNKQLLTLVGVGLSLVSCSRHQQADIDFSHLTPQQNTLIRETPIIDVHVHTFNSKFLPLRGIALGKRDANIFFSLVSDPLAIAATSFIDQITDYNRNNSAKFSLDMVSPSSSFLEKSAQYTASKIEEQRLDIKALRAEDLNDEPLIQGIAKIASGEQSLTAAELRAVNKFGRLFDSHGEHHGHKKTNHAKSGGARPETGALHFIKRLTQSENDTVGRLVEDMGRDQDLELIVSHMMDLAPIYDQKDGTKELLSISEQLAALDTQKNGANENGVKMLYFVAYNPFRDNWPENDPGKALEIVKEAFENGNASGVKIYPPSGYRPYANKIKRQPLSFFTPHPRKQYQARYKTDGQKMSNDELDQRLLALFLWAAENDVPLFAHCGIGEFEARKNYGLHHADPKYWRMLLEKYPVKLRNLRLCLAHAGGEAHWFKSGRHRDWGETVEFLCTHYPNIYCEFGATDEILVPKSRAHFVDTITQAIQTSGEGTKRPYPFAEKIIYGSDYFMPVSGNTFANYLKAFQVAALEVDENIPQSNYRNFFRENAFEFLKLD